MGRALRRIRYLLSRRRLERELAEEMDLHRALSGGPAFGNVTLAREDARAVWLCLLYTSPSPRDRTRSRMPSSA